MKKLNGSCGGEEGAWVLVRVALRTIIGLGGWVGTAAGFAAFAYDIWISGSKNRRSSSIIDAYRTYTSLL